MERQEEEVQQLLMEMLNRGVLSKKYIEDVVQQHHVLAASKYDEYLVSLLNVSPHASRVHDEYDDDALDEDYEINERIIKENPKKLFSKLIAVYSEEYNIKRNIVCNKLRSGVVVSRKMKQTRGELNNIQYYQENHEKVKKTSLEVYGYQKKLMRIDYEQGRLLIYSRGSTGKERSGTRQEKVSVSNKWLLEDEVDLDEIQDVVLPDTTMKMLKARLKEFYNPVEFDVYNKQELKVLEECNYFTLTLATQSMPLHLLVDDFALFLDVYAAMSYLQFV